MRCREARLRLNEISLTRSDLTRDKELLEHLESCRECARQAQAVRDLHQALADSQKLDEAEGLSWQELRRRVEAKTAPTKQRQPMESPIMSAMKRQFRRRPRLGIGLAVAVVALLAITTIPLKFNRTVGFEVAVAGVDRDLAYDTNKINDLLVRLGVEDASVQVLGCEETCNLMIGALNKEGDAQLVAAAFEELGEAKFNGQIIVDLRVVTEKTDGSALDHATHLARKIQVVGHHEMLPDSIHQLVIECIAGGDGEAMYWVDDSGSAEFDVHVITTDADGSVALEDMEQQIQIAIGCDSLDPMMKSQCIILGADNKNDVFGAVIQPDQIVNGHLTVEAREALEAQGYEIEESVDEDGLTVLKMTSGIDGDESIIELRLGRKIEEFNDDGTLKATAEVELPEGFELAQNYPNPFNPQTQIDFNLPQTERVTLEVYNIQGQKVRTLVDGVLGSGPHTITWDATSDTGDRVASGVYLYRLTAGNNTVSKKMTLVK